MGALGVWLAILGGLVMGITGLTQGDAVISGLGAATAGSGMLLWELLVAITQRQEPAVDRQP